MYLWSLRKTKINHLHRGNKASDGQTLRAADVKLTMSMKTDSRKTQDIFGEPTEFLGELKLFLGFSAGPSRPVSHSVSYLFITVI